MILVTAILFALAAVAVGVMIEWANMMSDNPYLREPHYIDGALAAISVALFIWWGVG